DLSLRAFSSVLLQSLRSTEFAAGDLAVAGSIGAGQTGHAGRRSGTGQIAAGAGPLCPADYRSALSRRPARQRVGQCHCLECRGWRSGHDSATFAGAGADLERVFVPCQEVGEVGQLFRLPAGIAQLDSALERTGARLVVLDPLVAFLEASISANSDQAVRC